MEKKNKTKREPRRKGGIQPDGHSLEHLKFLRYLHSKSVEKDYPTREFLRLVKRYGLNISQYTLDAITKDVKNERLYKVDTLVMLSNFYFDFTDQNPETYKEYEAESKPNQSEPNP